MEKLCVSSTIKLCKGKWQPKKEMIQINDVQLLPSYSKKEKILKIRTTFPPLNELFYFFICLLILYLQFLQVHIHTDDLAYAHMTISNTKVFLKPWMESIGAIISSVRKIIVAQSTLILTYIKLECTHHISSKTRS
jgi:hypothetical protein